MLRRLRPRLPSPLARRSALRRPSVVHTRGMSVLVHAWSRPAFAKPAAAAAALESEKYGELSSHELDEINDESLSNLVFT